VTCCYRFGFFKLYSFTIQVVDLGDNGIADTNGDTSGDTSSEDGDNGVAASNGRSLEERPSGNTDGTLLESLAHLPLKHSSLTNINLGGNNGIKAAAFLVENLCNVNKSQAANPVHCLCEKISLL
jgi:hypothetical protein